MKRRIKQICTTLENAEIFELEVAVSADGQDASEMIAFVTP